jgi:uncharacterized ferritin-like protein (DUF455 family)
MLIRSLALAALEMDNVQDKLQATHGLAAALSGERPLNESVPLIGDREVILVPTRTLPGRPALPALVRPASVPRRSPATVQGRAALMHAVAHIEFNAVNLALDAVWRFAGMPEAYYRDWVGVAAEEAQHFQLVDKHLQQLGHQYGDFDAHNGLWEMVEKTSTDITARMALVPRTLEARGLDATPPIQRKLAQAGDHGAVAVLDIILRDEIGHVAIGNRWYRWCCARDGLDPIAHYAELSQRYNAPPLKGPFNRSARLQAGFLAEELALLPPD